jgi:hypothetical protein
MCNAREVYYATRRGKPGIGGRQLPKFQERSHAVRIILIFLALLLITLPLMAEEWQVIPGEDNAVLMTAAEGYPGYGAPLPDG